MFGAVQAANQAMLAVNKIIICFAQQLTGFRSNGPGLEYKVQWRQKDVDEDWSTKSVANVSELVVPGTPTYVPYEIKVQAVNDYGEGPKPDVVIGYSGEDCESTGWMEYSVLL